MEKNHVRLTQHLEADSLNILVYPERLSYLMGLAVLELQHLVLAALAHVVVVRQGRAITVLHKVGMVVVVAVMF
jgi:hypothetical protein